MVTGSVVVAIPEMVRPAQGTMCSTPVAWNGSYAIETCHNAAVLDYMTDRTERWQGVCRDHAYPYELAAIAGSDR